MRRNSRICIYGLGTVLLVLCSFSLVSIALSIRDQETYPSTFVIGDFRLDSVPRVEVPGLLPEKIVARDGRALKLLFADSCQMVELPMEDCGLSFDFPATVEALDQEIFAGGLSGIYKHSIIRGSLAPMEIKPVLVITDPLRLRQQLEAVKQDYDRKAIDASAWVAGEELEFSPHQDGRQLDLEATLAQVTITLAQGSLGPVKVQAVSEPARINSSDLSKVDELLGVAAGGLDKENDETGNRLNGLKNEINGCVLTSEDSLLLSKNPSPGGGGVKSVLAADGAARIIAGACADAGLEVEERSDGYLVRNHQDTAVMLWLDSSGYTLLAKVYGHQAEEGKEVRLVTEDTGETGKNPVYYREVIRSGQEPVRSLLYDPSGQEPEQPGNHGLEGGPDFLAGNENGPASQLFKGK